MLIDIEQPGVPPSEYTLRFFRLTTSREERQPVYTQDKNFASAPTRHPQPCTTCGTVEPTLYMTSPRGGKGIEADRLCEECYTIKTRRTGQR
jgi:hypothetical protein